MTPTFAPQDHITADQHLDLLHNFLVGEEREHVLAHLAACPDCERVFREQFAQQERLRARWALRRSSAGVLEMEQREVEPASVRAARWRFLLPTTGRARFAFGAAAAAAAIVLLLAPWRTPDGDSPAGRAHWLPAPTAELQVRHETTAARSRDLSDGLEAYARHDLDAAIDLLGRAEATGVDDLVRRVYLGNALALAGRHAQAVDVLGPATSRPLPDPWGAEARWSLYIALAGSGRHAEADSLLGAMAREPGAVGERARATLTAPSGTGR